MKKILKNIRTSINSWSFTSIILVSLICVPILTIFINIFSPTNENLNHIVQYLLPEYIKNTLIIAVSVGLLSSIIGVSLAWILSIYEFRGRKFFSWALILPLAIPSYIAGYAYSGIFSYTGIIPSYLRNTYGINFKIDILNIYGVIAIFTICFYPYVFLVVKGFLNKQDASLIEASKSLGKSNFETFIKVVLPLTRGAIVGGVSLVIMEVLNAYGLVSHFGVNTFSTGIFKIWLSLDDVDTAIKLSALLMLFVFSTILIEKYIRKRKSFSYSSTNIRPIKRLKLEGYKKFVAFGICSTIFLFAFIIPLIQLLYWAFLTYNMIFQKELLNTIINTIVITSLSSILIVIISIIIANSVRLQKNFVGNILSKLATMGYSIPGAVIAIGIMLSFVSLDKFLAPVYNLAGIDKKLVLTLSFSLLVSAYIVRFMAVSFNAVENGFDKVGLKFHEASRSLGKGISQTFFKIDLPMIKSSLIGAFILVFIEIIKELPLTLLLRPFNFHTLATLSKQYAEDEMIPESAIPSLIIIFICFLAIYFFNKLNGRKKR